MGRTREQRTCPTRARNKKEMIEIHSALCKDTWSRIIEFCDTREWLKLSYTCRGINQCKFNRLLMSNKRRTLKRTLNQKEIEHWFRLEKGTLLNVDLNENEHVSDEHFQYLQGIHTLNMTCCEQISDNAFVYLTGIHILKMSSCRTITDNAFVYLRGIHTLIMMYCVQITDQALSHLIGIHTLDMSSCEQITDNAFIHLSGIHTLKMRHCNQITDKAFPHLIGIRQLDLSGCKNITDGAFPYLSGIHILNMSGCKKITDQAFWHLTGLHTLNMSGCSQKSITEKGLLCLKDLRKLIWSNNGRDNAFIQKVVDYCESNSITLTGMGIGLRDHSVTCCVM